MYKNQKTHKYSHSWICQPNFDSFWFFSQY